MSENASPGLYFDTAGLVISLQGFNVCEELCFCAAGAAQGPGWFKNSFLDAGS